MDLARLALLLDKLENDGHLMHLTSYFKKLKTEMLNDLLVNSKNLTLEDLHRASSQIELLISLEGIRSKVKSELELSERKMAQLNVKSS